MTPYDPHRIPWLGGGFLFFGIGLLAADYACTGAALMVLGVAALLI